MGAQSGALEIVAGGVDVISATGTAFGVHIFTDRPRVAARFFGTDIGANRSDSAFFRS